MALDNGAQERTDDFFAPLENTKPYLKVAFEGFAGSGKTFTMADLAIGLHKRIGSAKPIVVFDTEEAAKFLQPIFKEAGIQALHKRSRSLADLKETMRRCRDGAADVLMIDSISHVWENFIEAYKRKKNRDRLQFEDWGLIKPEWKRDFSEPFVRDPYHTLMTGRAGYEYEDEKDENGKRQIYKSGIKMKVEGETAYEPDILVLMQRFEEVLTDDKQVWREATVIKDRSTLIDGKTFRNPTFASFIPAIERILEAPVRTSAPVEADAGALFKTEEDKRAWIRDRDIALEEIQGYLVSVFPGQTATEKKGKADALDAAFQTRSWKAIEQKRPEDLRAGLEKIRAFVARLQAAAGDGMSAADMAMASAIESGAL